MILIRYPRSPILELAISRKAEAVTPLPAYPISTATLTGHCHGSNKCRVSAARVRTGQGEPRQA